MDSASDPTDLNSQCGPTCSQNIAYSQPFLSSLKSCNSRITPECFLHRPNIPFVQKPYTEDKERDEAAVTFWQMCRQTDIEDWAWLAKTQSPRTTSVGSGSTIIDMSRQIDLTENTDRKRISSASGQEDAPEEPTPKNKKLKLIISSNKKGQISIRAKSDDQAESETSTMNLDTPSRKTLNSKASNGRASNAKTSPAKVPGGKKMPVGKQSRGIESKTQLRTTLPLSPSPLSKRATTTAKPPGRRMLPNFASRTANLQQSANADGGHAKNADPVSNKGTMDRNLGLGGVRGLLFPMDFDDDDQDHNQRLPSRLERAANNVTPGSKRAGSISSILNPAPESDPFLSNPSTNALTSAVADSTRKSARLRANKRVKFQE